MAASKHYCESCVQTIDLQNDKKILKCANYECFTCLHYNCSSYKAPEIKFLETAKFNVKWFCNRCATNTSSPEKENTEKINMIEKQVSEIHEHIKQISLTVINQNQILNNLQNKPVLDKNETRNEELQKTVKEKDRRKIGTRSQTTEGVSKDKELKIDRENETGINKNVSSGTKPIVNREQKEVIENIDIQSDKNWKLTKNIRGKNINTTLTAVPNRKWIFVSNFVNKTTEKDIEKHLSEYNISLITCEKLEINNKEIAAFKIAVAEKEVTRIFDANIWPENAIVRPFRNFQRKASKPAIFPAK